MRKLIPECIAMMIFCFVSALPNAGADVSYTYDQAGNILKRATKMPFPTEIDIKADDSDGPVTVSSGANVWLSIGLTSGGLSGINADWWLVSLTPAGTIQYMDLTAATFVDGLAPTFQGPLGDFDITPFIPLSNLSAGTHTFYFAIDTYMNGVLDIEHLYYDIAIINVSQ